MSSPTMMALRDLGEWTGGNTPSKTNAAYWANGTVPWVSPKDMKVDAITSSQDWITEAALNEGRASLVPEGSVLFVTRSGILAHTLPVAVTKLPVTINQDLKALAPRPGILPEYVAHAVRGASRRILKECSKHGTTVASIETNALLDFEIPLVDIDAQRRIVGEIEKQFSRLDEAIANLQRVKANLKHYKAAVLKSAVEGHLVPTEAELARSEKRAFETGAQLLQRILEARRTRWEGKRAHKVPTESDAASMPELPDGWAWASWDQIGLSKNGRAFPSTAYGEEGVKLLRPGNLEESGSLAWTPENTRYLPEKYADENPDLIVRGGELVMNLTAQSLKDEFLGRICRTRDDERCLLNQRLARLTPVLAGVGYLMVVFKSPWFRRFVDGLNTGSLIQHMFTSQLGHFAVPLPPLAEQQRITREVDRRLSAVAALQQSLVLNLGRVQRLRQAALSAAFSVGD